MIRLSSAFADSVSGLTWVVTLVGALSYSRGRLYEGRSIVVDGHWHVVSQLRR